MKATSVLQFTSSLGRKTQLFGTQKCLDDKRQMPQDGNRSRVPPSPLRALGLRALPLPAERLAQTQPPLCSRIWKFPLCPESLNTDHHWFFHGQSASGPGIPTDANTDGTTMPPLMRTRRQQDHARSWLWPIPSVGYTVFLTISTQNSANPYFPQVQLWWEQEEDLGVPATGPLYGIGLRILTARFCSHIHTAPWRCDSFLGICGCCVAWNIQWPMLSALENVSAWL